MKKKVKMNQIKGKKIMKFNMKMVKLKKITQKET